MREVRCTFRKSAYLRERLSSRPPFRSAVPLASVGIICLGLVPTLGGPDRPLHWAMTIGVTGFGLLLAVRHRLRQREAPLAPITEPEPRQAGRALLRVSAIITLLVVAIVARQLAGGGPIGAFSIALPVLGLTWLISLGVQAWRLRAEPAEELALTDRPSLRPASWERLTPPGSSPPGDPGRHASA